MELTQLDYFLTVSRLQHMTMAAKELNVTQPALSHAISKLESELGVPLFDRGGRNLRLNRYGAAFAKWVDEALASIRKGMREIEESSSPDTGVIPLSYLNILGVDLVPSLVTAYLERYPKVRFELIQGDNADIDEQLESGRSDLLLTSKETVTDNREWIVIRRMPLYVVVPERHRFANLASIRLAELSGQPFVGLSKNCGLRDSIRARAASADFALASAYDAEDLITVAGFIKAGLGVSVLPRTPGLLLDGLVWIPIRDEDWQWELGLKWRRDRYLSPAAKRFIAFVRERSLADGVAPERPDESSDASSAGTPAPAHAEERDRHAAEQQDGHAEQ
ncbi:DNA-binding transcriptional regulator, LysR family [Paenibacillus sp. UNC496MF]|nr:DNA-binding transcriptional regulator, LysR family [Paenibacillus sp. UNC496MF]